MSELNVNVKTFDDVRRSLWQVQENLTAIEASIDTTEIEANITQLTTDLDALEAQLVQQGAINDAETNHTAIVNTNIKDACDALGAKQNEVLAALRTLGLINS